MAPRRRFPNAETRRRSLVFPVICRESAGAAFASEFQLGATIVCDCGNSIGGWLSFAIAFPWVKMHFTFWMNLIWPILIDSRRRRSGVLDISRYMSWESRAAAISIRWIFGAPWPHLIGVSASLTDASVIGFGCPGEDTGCG